MTTRKITRRGPPRPKVPSWTPHPDADIQPDTGRVFVDGHAAETHPEAMRGALRTIIRRGHIPLSCERSIECFRCAAGASIAPMEGGGWRCAGNTGPDWGSDLLAAPGCARDRNKLEP